MARHGASPEAEKRAQQKYEKTRLRQVKLALNDRTDADIIAFLDTLENKRAFILAAIRSAMAAAQEKDPE